MSKAEYNRQYRTPVLTTPLTQLCPDAGPTIIQHEAVTVYNSVNKRVRDVIDFLHEALLAYTKEVLKLLKKRYHELPLILGDVANFITYYTWYKLPTQHFNIQFNIDEGLRCVQFSKIGTEFGLRFCCHKPIVIVKNNDITFDEINNVQDDFDIEENHLSL
ncbi:hypothetical protein PV328_004143 [Microctonus aethiopoides]|uniref:Uncharacterized protein n=1 Tax=Microctonus aethiopoides TaxID=144406 RepID=A0AA39KLE3_9HYME|nr:hypothetical protein PV328_004143 [Microctonus aethiopoides]